MSIYMTEQSLKQTPLHDTHTAQGAKMVDFGGWHMPIHYGSQIQEHQAVRQNVGVFDVSHMCVCDIQGTHAQAFLRYVLANDVQKLKANQALYSCMLNQEGGVVDDLIVYHVSDLAATLNEEVVDVPATHHYYRLVLNAGCAPKDIAWLQTQAAIFLKAHDAAQTPHALKITPQASLNILALQGPKAAAVLEKIFTQHIAQIQSLKTFFADAFKLKQASHEHSHTIFIGRTGYTGEDGFEIILPQAIVQDFWQKLMREGVQPCGLGARDTLRLEAGMHLYGQDMDEQTKPYNASLSWTLDHSDTNRNYIGKTALLAHQATHHILGLYLKSGGILRAHQKIETAFGDGEITSGTFSPTMNCSIAMAKLPKDVKVGDFVHVQIRQQSLKVKVVKLPFVRLGQIKVVIEEIEGV
jgi:aminomethyltransferase